MSQNLRTALRAMDWKGILRPAIAFGLLWLVLINQLRVEWANNAQYAYGWAVPFLCLYLVWRRLRTPMAEDPSPSLHLPSSIIYLPFLFLALAYAPTRLVQEAIPDWRLLTWLLAFEVVGLTLLFLHLILRPSTRGLRISQFAFPICFFLVAIPWPRGLMKLVVQGLAGLNVSLTTEVLGWCGIIAIQHGNVVEINTGVVGIDEACSGIRSFQATLMISLFLGEVYRLGVLRRVLCVLAGFGLAFLFNTGRTFVLVYVAARKGVEAIAQWHDPAGISILVGCFIVLWLAVLALRPKAESGNTKAEGRNQKTEHDGLSLVTQVSAVLFPSSLRRIVIGLFVWLLVVEAGIGMWYRHLESNLPRGPEWAVVWPEENPTFKELPISVWVRSALQFDEGRQAEWWEPGGIRWQAFYSHWFPGRAAGYLAQRHTPEICLPSAGFSLGSASELRLWDVHGLRLPFRRYVFTGERQTVHVFHCRWEEGVRPESHVAENSRFLSLIRGVWAGRGNLNQKVLELMVWGIDDAAEAEAAAQRQLERLIQVTKPAER